VELEEINAVGLKATEGVLNHFDDVVRFCSPTSIGHGHAKFGGNDSLIASTEERLAELRLTLGIACAIGIGSVEEGNAGIKRGMNHGVSAGLVEPFAEVIAPQSNHGDLQTTK